MSFSRDNQGSDRYFNNPDSFAMAFDDAWKNDLSAAENKQKKLKKVLEKLQDHPLVLCGILFLCAVRHVSL